MAIPFLETTRATEPDDSEQRCRGRHGFVTGKKSWASPKITASLTTGRCSLAEYKLSEIEIIDSARGESPQGVIALRSSGTASES